MSSGGSESKSTSKPLTGRERASIFNWGMNSVQSGQNSGVFQDTDYNAPQYQQSNYQAMNDGDYDAYEQALYDSQVAGLDQYEQRSRENVDQDAANRGIWSSGVAMQNQNDLTDAFADNYQSAGANAAAQRYQMQQQDLQNQNNYNMNNAAMENQFNQNTAQQEYASQWAPLEYLMGMYNQTGGAVSSSKSSGGGGMPFNLSLGF